MPLMLGPMERDLMVAWPKKKKPEKNPTNAEDWGKSEDFLKRLFV